MILLNTMSFSSYLEKHFSKDTKILSSKNTFSIINSIDTSVRRLFLNKILEKSKKPNFSSISDKTPEYEIKNNIIIFNKLFRNVVKGDVVPGTCKKFTEPKYGKYYEFRFVGEGYNNGNLYIHENDIELFVKLNIDKQTMTNQIKDGSFKNLNINILFDYTNNKGPLRNINDSYVKFRKKDNSQSIMRSPSWYERDGVEYAMDDYKKNLLIEVSAYWEHFRKDQNMQDFKFIMYGNIYSPMIDMVTKTLIEVKPDLFFNDVMQYLIESEESSFYIHHMKVMDNNSVHKGDVEPSSYLRSNCIRNNKDILIELMKCVVLSDDTHKKIHRLNYSDGMLYMDKNNTSYALPWGISSEDNFLKIKEKFPVLKDVSFEEVFSDIFFSKDEMLYISNKLKLSL